MGPHSGGPLASVASSSRVEEDARNSRRSLMYRMCSRDLAFQVMAPSIEALSLTAAAPKMARSPSVTAPSIARSDTRYRTA